MRHWIMTLSLFGVFVNAGFAASQTPAASKATSAKLIPTPFIARTGEGERQVILIEITSEGLKGANVRLTKQDWTAPAILRSGGLAKGKQILKMHVPVATKGGSVRGTLETDSERLELPEVTLQAPKKWTVYLAEHTHTDIGYTRPQTEILPEHLRYIDTALDFCDLTDNYPDDAKFRWTCEISWAVREYLRRRPPEQIARLKRRVAEGRIELTGMFLNMSEIADENSLAASLQPLRDIQKAFGKSVRSAMQNDVNGAAWCLPDYYNGVGVRYLIMGINKTRSILPFDKPTPFWWESPSGKRLLAFRADHYMTANSWKIHEGKMDLFEPGLAGYLNNLTKIQYPFDRIGVQFSGYYTDNSPPASTECDLVKAWNEAYVTPRLRIATAGEYPEYVEKNHASELPVHRQAWPDWWTDGFGSAARETAASREMHAAMQINEALLGMAAVFGTRPAEGWSERAAAIQESLLFYDEHTFGAAESISKPFAENSQVQWAEKSAYAWEAVKNANLLREEALGLLQDYIPRSRTPVIAVFNTLGRARSGLIQAFIDHEILPKEAAFRIVDAKNGEEIPAQLLSSRNEGSYWAIWAKEIPALGFRTYRIEVTNRKEVRPPAGKASSNILENAYYRIEVDPQTGAVGSMREKDTGRELVDGQAPWKLGQFIYERTKNREDFNRPSFKQKEPFQRTTLRKVQLGNLLSGPVWKSLSLKADADGCSESGGVELEIRLYETEKRVEFHFRINKSPVTAPEAVYVAFPFNGAGTRVVYEGQGGVVTPGEGQLPGSASDWQTIQSFVAVRNAEGQILLACDRTPLVQLGEINLGKWQPVTRIARPHVYSWVMNNYWFTNFRASQEGEFRWVYCLTSGRDSSNTAASNFGWASRVPLVARVLTAGETSPREPSLSALQWTNSGLILVAARPAQSTNGIILHLREVEGKSAIAKPVSSISGLRVASVAEVNVLEEDLKGSGTEVAFSPYEAKFIRVILKKNN